MFVMSVYRHCSCVFELQYRTILAIEMPEKEIHFFLYCFRSGGVRKSV